MVRVISIRHITPAGFKLAKLFGIYDFSVAKDSGKILIIIIYCFYNYILRPYFSSFRANEKRMLAIFGTNIGIDRMLQTIWIGP